MTDSGAKRVAVAALSDAPNSLCCTAVAESRGKFADSGHTAAPKDLNSADFGGPFVKYL
jgi:hypothetical protein